MIFLFPFIELAAECYLSLDGKGVISTACAPSTLKNPLHFPHER